MTKTLKTLLPMVPMLLIMCALVPYIIVREWLKPNYASTRYNHATQTWMD